MRAFIERAIRLFFRSTVKTFTLTIWPALTASDGSLMKRFDNSLMWTKRSPRERVPRILSQPHVPAISMSDTGLLSPIDW
jgi:hypothetical protein